ncbi:MAG: DUF86 domain-containing protein [Nocardioidaceae bacterium]
MQPDAPALLWDARRAVQLIQDFIAGESLDQYERDAMLRSAVERQFEVIGEALNKLKRADPDTAARIAELPKIVAFRNILAHGYATIDNVVALHGGGHGHAGRGELARFSRWGILPAADPGRQKFGETSVGEVPSTTWTPSLERAPVKWLGEQFGEVDGEANSPPI